MDDEDLAGAEGDGVAAGVAAGLLDDESPPEEPEEPEEPDEPESDEPLDPPDEDLPLSVLVDAAAGSFAEPPESPELPSLPSLPPGRLSLR